MDKTKYLAVSNNRQKAAKLTSTLDTNKATLRQRGFTIVELLIVIVVIGILAAISIVAYNGIQEQARDARRTSDIATIKRVVELYRIEHGVYPHICEDYNSACSAGGLEEHVVPDYVNSLPSQDPGGFSYEYVRDLTGSAYGVLARYESEPICKVGVNNGGFWGSSVPKC